MTTPPDPPPSAAEDPTSHSGTQTAPPPEDDGPRVTAEEVRDLGRLRRTATDRRVAGVGGGLARHLDLDPLVVRITLVVLVFFGGAGLVLYLTAWLLVPVEGTERALVRLDPRTRSALLVVAGAVAVLCLVGDAAGEVGLPWPVAVLGLLVVALLASRGRSRDPDVAAAGPPHTAPARAAAASPYVPYAPPGAPRPDRGPLLFWYAVAGTALGCGLLGLLDVGGVPVPAAAYPALALTLCGGLLVLGAFWGRPGGLVALGLVATLATLGTQAEGGEEKPAVLATPSTAAALAPSYETGIGDLVVDLSDVDDVEALDGRALTLRNHLGRILLIVPPEVDVRGQARVDWIGEISAFGRTSGTSLDLDRDARRGPPDAPTLDVDAEVGLGEIVVRTFRRSS